MDPTKFFGYNILAIGGILIVILLYLVFLINKRRRQKFLHTPKKQSKDDKRP